MKRYCASCGSPTEYTIKKPLFCSSCAKPFDKLDEAPIKPVVQKVLMQKKTISSKKYIEDIDADVDADTDTDLDMEDDVDVPNISKLEVEAEDETPKSKGIKIGSLMGTSSTPSKRSKQTKNSKTSKKQTLEDFSKEAGTLRRSRK
jgi:hypothetical protein